MSSAPMEDGLHVVNADDEGADPDVLRLEDGEPPEEPADSDLEDLRDAFVEGFNNRDVDSILAVVRADVECPDLAGVNGAAALAEELESIWERSPEAFLTRGIVDGEPVAVAWRPDEVGRWTRVALVCFDADGGLLSVVCLPDDTDLLERAEAEHPTDGDLDEWNDWSEWDRGEETVAPDPLRERP